MYRVVLLAAALLAVVPSHIRAAEGPESTIPGDAVPVFDAAAEAARVQRSEALLKLAEHPSGALEPRILTALRDADPSIRVAGALLAGEVRAKTDALSTPLIAALLRACGDSDFWVRRGAAGVLDRGFESSSGAVASACLALLDSPDPNVRASLIFAAARVPGAKAYAAIAGSVHDPDAHVRAHMLKALARQGGDKAVALIERRTAQDGVHGWVIWYGSEALVELKATAALRRLAGHANARVRYNGIRGLLELSDPAGFSGAVAMAADSGQPLQRRNALLALLGKAGYAGKLPRVPKAIRSRVKTPAPTGRPPAAYVGARPPWMPRLCVVDLGGGAVYVGWSPTRDLTQSYHLQRRSGEGVWQTVVRTRLGSAIDRAAGVGKRVAYRVLRGAEVSPIEPLLPSADAPLRRGLARVVANARRPILLQPPRVDGRSAARAASICEMAIGDLDNDGRLDFVVEQYATRRKRAVSATGRLLWERPYARNSPVDHLVTTAIADLDGDGRSEAVCFEPDGDRKWLLILDGATGRVKHSVDLAALTNNIWERRDKVLLIDRTGNGREDTIVFAHNVYGSCQAVAFDTKLRRLWTHTSEKPMGHKPRIVDLNGDGRDEILLGGDCIDADGKLLWQMPGVCGDGHADRIEAMEIDPVRPGLEIVAAGCGDDNTWMVDWRGKLVWLHDTGHSQWLEVGRFDRSGAREVWMRSKFRRDGGKRISPTGELLGETPIINFGARIDWDGDPTNGDELLLGGGRVYSPAAGKVVFTAGVRRGRYRVADVCGDAREEIIVLDAQNRRIEILTNPTVCTTPQPDRWDHGYWRYLHRDRKGWGRTYRNPPV